MKSLQSKGIETRPFFGRYIYSSPSKNFKENTTNLDVLKN